MLNIIDPPPPPPPPLPPPDVYDLNRLHPFLLNVYDLPEVVLSNERISTINILAPAFSIETISAGFFGVFQLALKIARMGYNVRLVIFEKFDFDEKKFLTSLKNTTGVETLAEEVEICYIGDRSSPLQISPTDIAVASIWNSAYFAQQISNLNNKPFLYLIQDYETGFYPHNALFVLADATYKSMNYYGLISSEPLFKYLRSSGKCSNKFENNRMMFFNNSCANTVIDKSVFMKRQSEKTRKFVFYSRPTVERNMFSLAALAAIKAFNEGIFDDGHNWEFYGMGFGNNEIALNNGIKILQIPRMTLKEYEKTIQSFDVCLTLMASPHPSLIPFDLAGSGAVVVTNTFETKDQEYFSNINANIIAVSHTLDDLVFALKTAVQKAELFEDRYEAAMNMHYPKSWDETWTPKIEEFIKSAIIQNEKLVQNIPISNHILLSDEAVQDRF